MTKDELWYQFSGAEGLDGSTRMVKADFLAALKEYGEHVKSEAVKVLKQKEDDSRFTAKQMQIDGVNEAQVNRMNAHATDYALSAAAIEKMPLP